MITVYQFMRIVEIRTKVISVSAYLIGSMYAAVILGTWNWGRGLVLFAAILAVDMGTTAFNTFFDYFRGVDRDDRNREVDKVLVHQGVPPGIALAIAAALFVAAVFLGLGLAVLISIAFGSGPAVLLLALGAAGMAVGFLYNAGPLPISSTPLGEIFAGGFLGGLLVLLTVFVQTGSVGGHTWWMGVPSTLFVASILTVNNTCDIDGDRASGRTTLSIVIGRTGGELLVYLLGIGGFVTLACLGEFGVLPRLTIWSAIVAGVLSLVEYIRMHKQGYNHSTKGPSMGSISRIFLLYTLATIVPLLVSAVTMS